jgi:hypothetical protein
MKYSAKSENNTKNPNITRDKISNKIVYIKIIYFNRSSLSFEKLTRACFSKIAIETILLPITIIAAGISLSFVFLKEKEDCEINNFFLAAQLNFILILSNFTNTG